MEEKTKKRLFVAISLTDEIRKALDDLQGQMKRYARDAKWVKVSGIHMTLKFLGYVDPDRIPEINSLLTASAEAHPAVDLHVRGTGFFPNERRPAVFWAGVEAAALAPLQADVERQMQQLGFEKENRAFSPHLTLARFRDTRGLLPLATEAKKWAQHSFGQFTADHFSLYESILQRSGAEYHVVQSFPLMMKGGK